MVTKTDGSRARAPFVYASALGWQTEDILKLSLRERSLFDTKMAYDTLPFLYQITGYDRD